MDDSFTVAKISHKFQVNADKKKEFYSNNESRNAFILVCATDVEYKEMYDSKVKEESSVASYISIIGSLNEPLIFMVDFENIAYKVFSLAKAMDVCFKAYHVRMIFEIF